MINERMSALGKKRSCIREIFEYSLNRRREIGNENVFDFSLGNPSIPAPDAVGDKLMSLLSECDPVTLHGYTSAAGDSAVKETLCAKIRKRFSFPAEPSLMYMTCGAAASLTITLAAVTRPGEEVILPAPFFPEYRVFTENAGASVRAVPCLDGSFQLDIDAIDAAINEKTAAIIINSPNNPTGAVFTYDVLNELSQLLRRRSKEYSRPIILISDEPYRELVYGDVDVPYIPCLYENTVVCYSYSKSLSLPGERIGYILVSPEMQAADEVFAAVCGAGRSLGYVCAPSMLQRCVAECDGIKPDIASYDRNRTRLMNALMDMGYEFTRPDGAFYLFMKALESDAVAFCERAKKHELLLVPSDDFGVGGYVRIAYCVSYEQIERSLPAFAALAAEYKN